MKYLKHALFISVLMIVSSSFAQQFAPLGAVWHYTEGYAFSGDIDYLMIKSVKDTIIKEKQCQKLDCDRVCWNPSGIQFVHYSNDSLFFFDSKLDDFQLISAFNAQKGDSWQILIEDWDETIDTIKVNVDSTSTVDINGQNLSVLNVTYHLVDYYTDKSIIQDYYYSSKIIEFIGDVGYLFNFPSETGLMCDDNYSHGLRCYEDTDLGFYSTEIADSCTYSYKWTGMDNNIIEKKINVFPNPTAGLVKLDIAVDMEFTVQIYDVDGKMILTKVLNSDNLVDLTELPKGLYLLEIKNNDESFGVSKILKY